jgi:hypothetical protein
MEGLVAATRVSKAQFHVEGGAVAHHHEGGAHHEVLTGLLSRHAYAMVTKLSKFLSNFQNFTDNYSSFLFIRMVVFQQTISELTLSVHRFPIAKFRAFLFTAKRNNKYFGKLCDPRCLL